MDNQIRVFQKDQVIFKEGVYERCMYDIRSGSVNIYINYETEDEKLLTTLEAGQFFGEIGIAELMPRTATAIAAQNDTYLAEITVENFDAYFFHEPQKLLAIMRNMSARLRALTQDYLDACNTIREAVNGAKKGAKKSEGLAAKLARLAQNFIRPSILKSGKGFDADDQEDMCGDRKLEVRIYRKNEVIFREGDPADCMYDILYGSVGIYAGYGSEGEKCLAKLNEEAFFGEMGILEKMPRSASAVALDADTRVKVIPANSFGVYLQENPTKVMMIVMNLSSRIRELTKDYLEACRMAALAEKAAEDHREDEYWKDCFIEEMYEDYRDYEDSMGGCVYRRRW